MTETDVAVLGGGAAGLMAAIAAAGSGAETVVIEHTDRVGKKILSTGNGKCNYTNALQGVSFYRGNDPAFVLPVLEQFGLAETLFFFQKLGIRPREKNGFYYPASGQASSVLDVLRMEADFRGVRTVTSCQIGQIRRRGDRFLLSADKNTFLAKTVIFATGLLAAPKTGSDGSAILLMKKLGHHFVDVVPALVPLEGKQHFFKALAGVRTLASVVLYTEKSAGCGKYEKAAFDTGELQLTAYGISGIPVFQVSRYASRALSEKKRVYALLDFAPDCTDAELGEQIRARFGACAGRKTAGEAMIGLFDKKLNVVLLKEAGISPSAEAGTIQAARQKKLSETIRRLRVDVTATKGFEAAQVCAGGIDTAEIRAETMESRIVPGIFFAGEVVDIDGACGGYNLQWAWSSGTVAGRCAARRAGRQACAGG